MEGLRIYNLFPLLAGPTANWTAALPRIGALGFNAVYVNPFHETGGSGSLYAVKDHYRLNPRLRGTSADSDDEILGGFASACGPHKLLPMMDLVVGHVAQDSVLTTEHPEWFFRESGGGLRSPSAIDPANATKVTVWGDLAEIRYEGDAAEAAAIAYFQAVLRHYLGLGFRGFRCDAAYKVPARVWRALIGMAKELAPDCLFCAETVGARMEEVRALDGAGFDYLYNSAKWWDFTAPWLLEQYEAFRSIAPSIAFPESHDTPRLAAELEAAGIADPVRIAAHYRQAYAFAACFSAGVMMPMGYEFGWAQRLDVVKTRPEPPEPRRFDISAYIAAVNAMKGATPALNEDGPQLLLSQPGDPVTILARRTEAGEDWAFVLVNRDTVKSQLVAPERLLAAAPERNLLLEEVTPGGAAQGAIGLRLEIEPLSVRVLRGRDASMATAPSRPSRRKPRVVQSPDWSADSRIIIEEVYPELDGGRFPVKRVVGDSVAVWADIFRDGHDLVAAVVKYKPETASTWREAPLQLFDNDRWTGRFTVTENTRHRYTIEAWTDVFASWRADVIKTRAAGQPVTEPLAEGRAIVAAASERAQGADAELLQRLLAEFDAAEEPMQLELMLSQLLAQAVTRWAERRNITRYRRELELVVDRPLAGFAAWYEMMPRSQGKIPGRSASFDDAIERLPEIAAMGFDVVYLPPIHPIGRLNRKGRDNNVTAQPDDPGSPYAIGSVEGGHREVHAELGGVEGFRRFVAACGKHNLAVALDFAVQAAPDHPWVKEHPEWFTFRPDGTIKYAENPPKKYQDIVNVDFYGRDHEVLWRELRDTVLYWISGGVTIFRVDNPHTKPVPFWEWLIREVQTRYPSTIFLAEAFTRPKMMRALAKAGFTQSYSYFTWRNTKAELTEYLTELTQGPAVEYFRPNFFTNTPDILPPILQQGGRPAFLIRLVLAATLGGVYGIYNGYELCEATAISGTEEYLHSEKYEYKVWDWDRPGNIKPEITRLNRIRRANPALHRFANLRFYPADNDQVLFYGKMTEDRRNIVMIAVNLDPFQTQEAVIELPLAAMGLRADETFIATELLTGVEQNWRSASQRLRLAPDSNPAAIFRIQR